MRRTPKQREASRRNGAQSKGPKTEQGQARSARNSLEHGLCASRHVVLDNEDSTQYDSLLHGMLDSLKPANTLEETLVGHLVNSQWRLQRQTRLEAGLLTIEVDYLKETPAYGEYYSDPDLQLAQAFRQRAGDNALPLNLRYHAQTSRDFYRALKTILALRKSPNEPGTTPTPAPSSTSKPAAPPPPPSNPPSSRPAARSRALPPSPLPLRPSPASSILEAL